MRYSNLETTKFFIVIIRFNSTSVRPEKIHLS